MNQENNMIFQKKSVKELIIKAVEKQKEKSNQYWKEKLQERENSLRRYYERDIEEVKAENEILELEIKRLQENESKVSKLYDELKDIEKQYAELQASLEYLREQLVGKDIGTIVQRVDCISSEIQKKQREVRKAETSIKRKKLELVSKTG